MAEQNETLSPAITPPVSRSSKKPWAFLVFTVLIGLLGLLGWGLTKAQAGPVDRGRAPDFSLMGFDGWQVILSQLRGQVVIVNLWASWCLPCREEAAYLTALPPAPGRAAVAH